MDCDNFYGMCVNSTMYNNTNIIEQNENENETYLYYILGGVGLFMLSGFGYIYVKYISKVKIERNANVV